MASNNLPNDLSNNKHFLIPLMSPYILGARTQLGRTMEAHARIQNKETFTMTAMYTFIFEVSSLLEHLSMIQHLLHNAGIANTEVGIKILDIRDELRHDARCDNGKVGKKNKRSKRIGKNENMIFQFNASKNGIQCANVELTFNEIDDYINISELLMHSTLNNCTTKTS